MGLSRSQAASYQDPESEPPESQLPPSLPPLSHEPESDPPLSHDPESELPQSHEPESEPLSLLPLPLHQPPLLSLLSLEEPPPKLTPLKPPLTMVSTKPRTNRIRPVRYHQLGLSS
jgi:hypothetical protein